MLSLHQQHPKLSSFLNENNNKNQKSQQKMTASLVRRKQSAHCYKCNCARIYWKHSLFVSAVLILFIIIGNEIVEGALRNVNLIIEPPAVRRGQHAVLRCLYDLDDAPLYSAKFYRGQLEFYRYTPGEFPNTKVFPFPGIHVDVTSSNATQVLIRNVGFGLSGNFSCEVTTDAPFFSTATAYGIMQVVELPEKRPQLFTEHTRYEPGDILRANCSTPPSRPRAELKFTINNMVVGNADTQYIRTIDNLIASRISLKLQLQGIHFSSANPSMLHINSGGGGGGVTIGGGGGGGINYNGIGYGGQMMNSVHGPNGIGGGGGLILRCTAQIGELYQEYKEIELGTPQKDPVPARVTLSSSSGVTDFFSSYFSSSADRPWNSFGIQINLLLLLSATTLFGWVRIGDAVGAAVDAVSTSTIQFVIQLVASITQLLMYKQKGVEEVAVSKRVLLHSSSSNTFYPRLSSFNCTLSSNSSDAHAKRLLSQR